MRRTPAQGLLAYAAILGTLIAGIHHMSWWAAVAGASVLALISISNHTFTYRALADGGDSTYTVLYFSSALNAAAISAAALGMGNAVGWLLGF
jgi:hypothetical protein